MNVYMTNISFKLTREQLKAELAKVLHAFPYSTLPGLQDPMNFEVIIHPRRGSARCSGFLTLPSIAVGERFLHEFGGHKPTRTLNIHTPIRFQQANKPSPQHVLDEVRYTPYEDPRARQERERIEREDIELRSEAIALSIIQFGWECRDNVFSVEWERPCGVSCQLTFLPGRREFRISLHQASETRVIVIKASHINWASAGVDKSKVPQQPVLHLSLAHPPAYETEPSQIDMAIQHMEFMEISDGSPFASRRFKADQRPLRQRWSQFEHLQIPYVPFISSSIRLVCKSVADLETFQALCYDANMQAGDFLYPVVRRELFAPDVQTRYADWIRRLPWKAAFQVDALTRDLLVDMKEALALQTVIARLVLQKGDAYAASFLRSFGTQVKLLFHDADNNRTPSESVVELFSRCEAEQMQPLGRFRGREHSNIDTFECLHVAVTPTTYRLSGPYPERSNRVMRSYPNNHDSFLRVAFVDETDLQYQFDREVDGRSFIKRRVGSVLANGLDIAGRHFEFLAYSQSALREHAVWFVKEFRTPGGLIVNARTIIASLGNFSFEPELIYCPARFGARISQAFTATDSSVSVNPDEILIVDDVYEGPIKAHCFTDGVGTMSPQLAREIWKTLVSKGRGRKWPHSAYPRALQIRFQGSKGMLSVDHTLRGRLICLRPSMIKFEAPNTTHVEVARAFDRPGLLYLNRPLIMLLEALGVKYEAFHKLQREAVRSAQESIVALDRSARLLETHGLGGSFHLPSVTLSLAKLGLGPLSEDKFWHRFMDFAINHVLRELKHHARIPVPNAWNLVGVADVHGYLEEGEVFGCIVPQNGGARVYLEGWTLITRSPVIHPGDVQLAWGIGPPPQGSPFEKESLRNTIVFPTKGKRPIQSSLGGGDLDGDEYCVTMDPSLLPTQTRKPAPYTPAQRMTINRPSTMQDVADFVSDYITSDSLGLIAAAWLTIADFSPDSIDDHRCLVLAALYSDAVDYPKTGYPVPVNRIPKYRCDKGRPDWSAPEIVDPGDADNRKYYKSQRAIGKLYRDIDLPAVETIHRVENSQRTRIRGGQRTTLADVLNDFLLDDDDLYDDPVYSAVANRTAHFISLDSYDGEVIAEIWDLYCTYVSQLQTICTDYTLSPVRGAMLTEEEVIVGTIVAKCSQRRQRRDLMAKMREQTTFLVDAVRFDISGEEDMLPEKSMERAWVAFRLAFMENGAFGASSFGWISMGEIFNAIKLIEDTAQSTASTSRYSSRR